MSPPQDLTGLTNLWRTPFEGVHDRIYLRALMLINHIAITSVSGEVATNIYYHLKKDSPFTNTMMITMANDRIGYIVEDAAYETPTFEAMGTPLKPGTAEKAIVHGLVDLMSVYG